MPKKVLIVDYGMGNLNSVRKRMERMKVETVVSSNPADVLASEKIILPGVGHVGKAMANLKELNLVDALNEAVLTNKTPILGICLGMQLMANQSEEGNTEALGWFDADIVRFNVSDALKYKIPHIGWNQIKITKDSVLMRDVPEGSEFYFVHSYHVRSNDDAQILNETEYDYLFPSALEKENIFGVQYHPEKSQDVGAQLLKNFIDL